MAKIGVKSMVYCYECNLEFKHMNAFLTHHRWHHNGMTTKEYYDKHFKKDGEGICKTPECNNECTFYNLTIGYHKHCSKDCAKKDPKVRKKFGRGDTNRKKARKTCLKRYGVENVSQVELVKLKKEQTFKKRYGVKCNFSTEEHRQWMIEGGAAYCNRFIKNPSKPQIELFELCQQVFPYPILNYPCGRYSIDIAIPSLNLAIEYDGSYWHPDEIYDKKRQKFIENQGWKVIRFIDRVPDIDELKGEINGVF